MVDRFPVYPALSLWILVLTAATLFWVALTDLREFKVRNEFVAILAGLYIFSMRSARDPGYQCSGISPLHC